MFKKLQIQKETLRCLNRAQTENVRGAELEPQEPFTAECMGKPMKVPPVVLTAMNRCNLIAEQIQGHDEN